MPPHRDEAEFRFIGERDRFRSSFIRLVTATLVGPDGFTFERDIVRHPGAVCVVPLEDDGKNVVMVRQYRAPLDRYVLEVPAGKCDVFGEPLSTTAHRELSEEVGRECTEMTELGTFFNSPGFTDEETACFLAEDLTVVEQSLQGVEEQHMSVEKIAFADVSELVRLGVLCDAKTIISLSLAEQYLKRREGQSYLQ